MASSPNKDRTPSNKRTRPTTRGLAKTDKKKKLTTTSIASITPVNLDSDTEEEMGDRTKEEEVDRNEFQVKKLATIAVSDLEKLLDRRFAVLATAE